MKAKNFSTTNTSYIIILHRQYIILSPIGEEIILMNIILFPHRMKTIQEYTQEVNDFINERDWGKYQHPKDVAIALIIEAGEILEHFRFKQEPANKEALGEELADVFIYLVSLAHQLQIDLDESFHKKLEHNRKKYPIEKFYGKNKKYNEV